MTPAIFQGMWAVGTLILPGDWGQGRAALCDRGPADPRLDLSDSGSLEVGSQPFITPCLSCCPGSFIPGNSSQGRNPSIRIY